MIRNLGHAFLGAVAFFALAWLVTQPGSATWMTHHKDAHYAAAGALILLALFVLVCLVRAVRPRSSGSSRPATPYATTTRRR